MKKDNAGANYGEVLNKIKVALYIIIALFAVNVVINALDLSTVLKDRSIKETGDDNTDGEDELEYDVSKFTSVDYNGFKEAIDKDGYQVVYIGRSTCGYCAMFIPTMQQGQEEFGFTTLYFDITQVIDFSTGAVTDQTAHDEIVAIDEFFNDFGSTPMVAVFKDGEFVDGTIGYSEYDAYKTFLESVGMTKK